MDPESEIAAVLHRLVMLMVNHPDQVSIERSRQSSALLLELRVAPKDLGKVIGKQGKTARAFRQLLEAIGMTHNMRITFLINEDHARTPAADIEAKVPEQC